MLWAAPPVGIEHELIVDWVLVYSFWSEARAPYIGPGVQPIKRDVIDPAKIPLEPISASKVVQLSQPEHSDITITHRIERQHSGKQCDSDHEL